MALLEWFTAVKMFYNMDYRVFGRKTYITLSTGSTFHEQVRHMFLAGHEFNILINEHCSLPGWRLEQQWGQRLCLQSHTRHQWTCLWRRLGYQWRESVFCFPQLQFSSQTFLLLKYWSARKNNCIYLGLIICICKHAVMAFIAKM